MSKRFGRNSRRRMRGELADTKKLLVSMVDIVAAQISTITKLRGSLSSLQAQYAFSEYVGVAKLDAWLAEVRSKMPEVEVGFSVGGGKTYVTLRLSKPQATRQLTEIFTNQEMRNSNEDLMNRLTSFSDSFFELTAQNLSAPF